MKGCKVITWGSYYECTGDYSICDGCQYKGDDGEEQEQKALNKN